MKIIPDIQEQIEQLAEFVDATAAAYNVRFRLIVALDSAATGPYDLDYHTSADGSRVIRIYRKENDE